MAFENPGKVFSLPAAADLSASQYCMVTVNSSGQAALCGDGAAASGVLQNDPDAAGRAASVMENGISKVKAGAVLAAGTLFGSDATGRAVALATGDYVCGRTLEASTAANDLIACQIWPAQATA